MFKRNLKKKAVLDARAALDKWSKIGELIEETASQYSPEDQDTVKDDFYKIAFFVAEKCQESHER